MSKGETHHLVFDFDGDVLRAVSYDHADRRERERVFGPVVLNDRARRVFQELAESVSHVIFGVRELRSKIADDLDLWRSAVSAGRKVFYFSRCVGRHAPR